MMVLQDLKRQGPSPKPYHLYHNFQVLSLKSQVLIRSLLKELYLVGALSLLYQELNELEHQYQAPCFKKD